MIKETLSTDSARKFYDFWGARYDWFSIYEARAKARALELLDLEPGLSVLNVGVGTGVEHLEIKSGISPGGIAYGLDIAPNMIEVARQRTAAPLCLADGRYLPYGSKSFDRLFSAYTLDLIPASDLPAMLSGFLRVLKPGGRMVLVSLTEGVDTPSRALVSVWKAAYAISPVTCGGCRPLLLAQLIRQAGLDLLEREVIVQLGVPSEICVAVRNQDPPIVFDTLRG